MAPFDLSEPSGTRLIVQKEVKKTVKSSQTKIGKAVADCLLKRNMTAVQLLAIFLIDEGVLLAYNIQEI